MSLADAAQALKLGPRQVEALEAEDWKSLPGNTMIRGFVRNYARLLNIDAEALMRALDAAQLQQKAQLEASAGTTASLPHSGRRRAERRDYLAVIAGLVSCWAWRCWPTFSSRRPLAVTTGGADRSQAGATALRTLRQRLRQSQRQPRRLRQRQEGAAGESVTVLSAPHATVLSDASVAGGGLKLSFAQPAWVEVRDARVRSFLSGLSPAGSQRDVAGSRLSRWWWGTRRR
jgi:cytoskeleton protein RodZ